MKVILLIPALIFILLLNESYCQPKYAYDVSDKAIHYESIIPFNGKDQAELMKLVEKFLLVNDMPIRYKDESEIYAVGTFETVYRGYFLLFYNTTNYNMVYDLKFSCKDGKMKYSANNFFLLPKHINIRTKGGFINNWGTIGSTSFGGMWSTTKIPTEIPKKAIEVHYNAGKTKEKYKVFQDMDKNMELFENKLKKVVTEDKEW